MKSKIRLTLIAEVALAVTVTALLGGCGGGGSSTAAGTATGASGASGASGSSSTSALTVPPQTSVAAPTYASTSMQYAAFNALNAYRNAMGVGELSQDPILDTSAQAHATYLYANLTNGNLTALTHDEVSTYADYYEATPLSRADKAGAPATEWIGEVAGSNLPQTSQAAYGDNCVNGLLDTVYHLESVTTNQQTIGIGFSQPSANGYANDTCVIDFGQTAGVSGTPQANAINRGYGQQISTSTIVHSPLANETGVALAMQAETPNPASDVSAPGRPIMVEVNAATAGDVLTVASFTLTSSGGEIVPARIIIPSAALTGSTSSATADPNSVIGAGVAFLLPLAPLAANIIYTVSFSGARDGTPISTAWNFTTGTK